VTIAPATADRPDCTVVTVTYDSERHVDGFLDALDASAASMRVVVVDNASTDASATRARARAGVVVVPSEVNGGYAAGINLGRRLAVPARPVLVANPDLRFRPGAVEELLAALDDPTVGVAVPRLVDGDGLEQRSLRREPSVLRELGEAMFGDHVPRRPGWLSEVVRSDEAYRCATDVDWATGAAMMITPAGDRAITAWDESYFLYSEEVDAAARVRAAGLRIRYVPTATAEHDGGGSGSSASLVALQAVNRVRYFERRHGVLHSVAYRGAVALHEVSRGADPARRGAAGVVLRRSRWTSLPGRTP
jgi:GT2 family glycosyltransferase